MLADDLSDRQTPLTDCGWKVIGWKVTVIGGADLPSMNGGCRSVVATRIVSTLSLKSAPT